VCILLPTFSLLCLLIPVSGNLHRVGQTPPPYILLFIVLLYLFTFTKKYIRVTLIFQVVIFIGLTLQKVSIW